MNCLLCDQSFRAEVSWQALIVQTFPAVICTRCRQSFERAQSTEEVTALFTYNDAMKAYIQRYKFLKDVALAHVFRNELYVALHKRREKIVPVPLHHERLLERTFSQVHELLHAAKIPYIDMLRKEINDRQSQKTLQERKSGQNRFSLCEQFDVKDEELLIVDDIYTTGATVNDIKQLLLSNGAKKVSIFVLVKVKSDE